jgi:hypothetical protein
MPVDVAKESEVGSVEGVVFRVMED